MLHDLVRQTRSIRRFDVTRAIDRSILTTLVDHARLTSSTANKQPLRYLLSYKAETNAMIRPHTRWAGLLNNYNGPGEGENPTAYIIICSDKIVGASDAFSVDVGIAAQVIMMAARERGIGACMIGSFSKEALNNIFDIPENLEMKLVIALGYPAEEIILEEMSEGEPSAYYRDEADVHHVPKRKLCDIVGDLKTKI